MPGASTLFQGVAPMVVLLLLGLFVGAAGGVTDSVRSAVAASSSNNNLQSAAGLGGSEGSSSEDARTTSSSGVGGVCDLGGGWVYGETERDGAASFTDDDVRMYPPLLGVACGGACHARALTWNGAYPRGAGRF